MVKYSEIKSGVTFFVWLFFGGVGMAQKSPAPLPPMGWNSFDAWDCRINEAQFRASAEVIHDKFLKFGYNYVVLDYIWYHDNPGAWNNPARRYGHPDLKLDKNGMPLERIHLDAYGRVMPSPVRFPSAAGGSGLKPLADWVHAKGLKFGLHIMRGIPRQAYYDNLPVKGTKYTARDIAEPWDTCNWNNYMFGVDGSKPGAQAYYNSLFEQFAAWGVDFVKADNMMYPEYHNDDVEMMHNAIVNCGRPIVLSLSNGEAPIGYAQHLEAHANMWRVSGDFWDEWDRLLHNFDLLEKWSPFIKPGSWPDADMIPFGKISLDGRPQGPERITHYTRTEQHTLMTLWCMARSPLMIGAELASLDDTTYQILTNKALIEIDQHSINNRVVYKRKGSVVWMADKPESSTKYVAMFNTTDEPMNLFFDLEVVHLRQRYQLHDLWTEEKSVLSGSKIKKMVEPHGCVVYKLTESK